MYYLDPTRTYALIPFPIDRSAASDPSRSNPKPLLPLEHSGGRNKRLGDFDLAPIDG